MTRAWLTFVLCAAANGQARAPVPALAASKGSIAGQVVTRRRASGSRQWPPARRWVPGLPPYIRMYSRWRSKNAG